MARHEFRTSIGGGVIDHRDRRPGILTVPNHRWQALLQQVAGVEIQDDDIDGWGGQFVAEFKSVFLWVDVMGFWMEILVSRLGMFK